MIKKLKERIRTKFKPIIKRVSRQFNTPTVPEILESWKKCDVKKWPSVDLNDDNKSKLKTYEYGILSQNGEDGIIRYLFSEIGYGSKIFLEFGFGVTQNNSLRLMLHEGFSGLFIDGSKIEVKRFNQSIKRIGITNVKAVHKLITVENLKSIIVENELPKDIDLLSIDVDGNDYWFWEEITYLNPKIVIVEYNASLGFIRSQTVPYDPFFDRNKKHRSGFYHGASLAALFKLGSKKGYSLVGCDSNGVNAFFVRNDCLVGSIKALSPEEAFFPITKGIKHGLSTEEQYEVIKEMPYIDI